jgi:hypothetical protein
MEEHTSRKMGGHAIVVLLVASAEVSSRSGVAMIKFVVGGKSDNIIPQDA